MTGEEQQCDLFGTLSDSVVATDSDESDIDDSDVEPVKEGPGPSVPQSDKEEKQGRNKWSPTPRPVSEPENLC